MSELAWLLPGGAGYACLLRPAKTRMTETRRNRIATVTVISVIEDNRPTKLLHAHIVPIADLVSNPIDSTAPILLADSSRLGTSFPLNYFTIRFRHKVDSVVRLVPFLMLNHGSNQHGE